MAEAFLFWGGPAAGKGEKAAEGMQNNKCPAASWK